MKRAKSPKIIYVGSSAEQRIAIEQLLAPLGQFVYADSLEEASQNLDADECRLLVIDLELQFRSALQFCSRLQIEQPHVPILVLQSAPSDNSQELRIDFLFSGADDLFSWPVEQAALAARARSLLRRALWTHPKKWC